MFQLVTAVDATLPQLDRNAERRQEAVFLNRDYYYFSHFAGGIPTMVRVYFPSRICILGIFFQFWYNKAIIDNNIINENITYVLSLRLGTC